MENKIQVDISEVIPKLVPKALRELFDNLIGLAGGDKMKVWRLQNLISICEKSRKNNPNINIENIDKDKKFAIQFIEKASLEENEIMQEVWANLLSNQLKRNINVSYIEILSQLSNEDVLVLNSLCNKFLEKRKSQENYIERIRKKIESIEKILLINREDGAIMYKSSEKLRYELSYLEYKIKNIDLDILECINLYNKDSKIENIGLIKDNLLRLNLIKKGVEHEVHRVVTYSDLDEENGTNNIYTSNLSNKYINLTDLGKDFIECCRVENEKE